MKHIALPLALWLCLAPFSAAQEASGMLSGTLGGQQFELAVSPDEAGYGPADKGEAVHLCSVEDAILGSLCLGFLGEDVAKGTFTEAKVLLFPDAEDPTQAFLSDARLPLEFNTLTTTAEGGFLRIEGNVMGDIARVDTVNGGVDLLQTLSVSLRVEAVLGPDREE